MDIRLTFDAEGFPLALVNFSGIDTEMTADDCRSMALTLLYVAERLDATLPTHDQISENMTA